MNESFTCRRSVLHLPHGGSIDPFVLEADPGTPAWSTVARYDSLDLGQKLKIKCTSETNWHYSLIVLAQQSLILEFGYMVDWASALFFKRLLLLILQTFLI